MPSQALLSLLPTIRERIAAACHLGFSAFTGFALSTTDDAEVIALSDVSFSAFTGFALSTTVRPELPPDLADTLSFSAFTGFALSTTKPATI